MSPRSVAFHRPALGRNRGPAFRPGISNLLKMPRAGVTAIRAFRSRKHASFAPNPRQAIPRRPEPGSPCRRRLRLRASTELPDAPARIREGPTARPVVHRAPHRHDPGSMAARPTSDKGHGGAARPFIPASHHHHDEPRRHSRSTRRKRRRASPRYPRSSLPIMSATVSRCLMHRYLPSSMRTSAGRGREL